MKTQMVTATKTIAAMKEARTADLKTYSSVKDMMNDLGLIRTDIHSDLF